MERHISQETIEKYTEAYSIMCQRIKTGRLVVMKFLRNHNLPNNFVIACSKLVFIVSKKRGEYEVKLNVKSKSVGKAIAEKILEIEGVRKNHFKQTNR